MVVEPGYNSLAFSVKLIDRRQGDVLPGTLGQWTLTRIDH